jgi:hypothetical protein
MVVMDEQFLIIELAANCYNCVMLALVGVLGDFLAIVCTRSPAMCLQISRI